MNPFSVTAAGVFAVAAYLCFVNLDYVTLWYDEAVVSAIAKNLIEHGDIVGWDGRNFVGGVNGNSLNDDLRDMGPPVQYLVTGAGFLLFGFNETGARIFHALAGILALGLFHRVLRQHLPNHPRLTFFIFLLIAWSPQLLLYFRQARYYSVTVLCMVGAFYVYERYWHTKRPKHLAALAAIALVAFFNHYASGAANMLALGAWHLLFRAGSTTRRDWLAFVTAGALTVALALTWLFLIGLAGGGRDPAAAFRTADFGPPPDAATLLYLKLWLCFRDLVAADWISWPVCLWFAAVAWSAWRRTDSENKRRWTKFHIDPEAEDLDAASRLVVLGALCALFTTLLSPQPVWLVNVQLDLRYFVAALPLLLVAKGLFTEWLWRRSRVAGAIALAVLLFTSAGAVPFNAYNLHTQSRTLGAHLFDLVREIHQPVYRTSIDAVSAYLLRHAQQDDLVEVPFHFRERDTLTFYVGHRVRFCHVLDEASPLPRKRMEALAPHLYRGQCIPDWIVVFEPATEEKQRGHPYDPHDYEVVAKPDVYYYLTQRPEIIWHAFEPLPPRDPFVHILRRRSDHP